jgi:ribosomal protein S18 acetylase RimI-like enzyme
MPETDANRLAIDVESPDSLAASMDSHVLDHPIWNALTTEHAHLALGNGLARRYPPEIGPLSGMVELTAAAYQALRELTRPGGIAGLFLDHPWEPQPGWTLVRDGKMNQMVCFEPGMASPEIHAAGMEIEHLTAADVPEMVALARLTEPGPFDRRTMELGRFFGIREAGRLAGMAGERMSWPGFREVSAVCTHPDARGRGYAKALISTVVDHIRSQGKTPMLHVFTANTSAIRVYEALGFAVRRHLELALLKRDG